MKRVRVLGYLPDGRVMCADGQIRRHLGNRPAAPDEWAWADGQYILGYRLSSHSAIGLRTTQKYKPESGVIEGLLLIFAQEVRGKILGYGDGTSTQFVFTLDTCMAKGSLNLSYTVGGLAGNAQDDSYGFVQGDYLTQGTSDYNQITLQFTLPPDAETPIIANYQGFRQVIYDVEAGKASLITENFLPFDAVDYWTDGSGSTIAFASGRDKDHQIIWIARAHGDWWDGARHSLLMAKSVNAPHQTILFIKFTERWVLDNEIYSRFDRTGPDTFRLIQGRYYEQDNYNGEELIIETIEYQIQNGQLMATGQSKDSYPDAYSWEDAIETKIFELPDPDIDDAYGQMSPTYFNPALGDFVFAPWGYSLIQEDSFDRVVGVTEPDYCPATSEAECGSDLGVFRDSVEDITLDKSIEMKGFGLLRFYDSMTIKEREWWEGCSWNTDTKFCYPVLGHGEKETDYHCEYAPDPESIYAWFPFPMLEYDKYGGDLYKKQTWDIDYAYEQNPGTGEWEVKVHAYKNCTCEGNSAEKDHHILQVAEALDLWGSGQVDKDMYGHDETKQVVAASCYNCGDAHQVDCDWETVSSIRFYCNFERLSIAQVKDALYYAVREDGTVAIRKGNQDITNQIRLALQAQDLVFDDELFVGMVAWVTP